MNKGLSMYMINSLDMSRSSLFVHQVKRSEIMFHDSVVSLFLSVNVSKENKTVLEHTQNMLYVNFMLSILFVVFNAAPTPNINLIHWDQ